MRSSGFAVFTVLVLAGCGGGSKSSTTTPTAATDRPCVHAADHLIDLTSAEAKDAPPEKLKQIKDSFVTRCETDKWSAAMQTCVNDAKVPNDLAKCDELLTPEQRDALSKESAAEAAPGGAGAGAPPPPAPRATAPAPASSVMPAPKTRGPAKKSGDPCEGGE